MVSIRTKLFVSLLALVSFFGILVWLVIDFGLERYYLWQKESVLLVSSRAVADQYDGDPEHIELELERLASTLGAGVVILDGDKNVKYTSFGPLRVRRMTGSVGSGANEEMHGPPKHIDKDRHWIDEHTMVETQQDLDLKIDFLVWRHWLPNGDSFIVRQPLAPVSESANLAARFMLFAGLVALLAGSCWAFLFARRFTAPILELNRIAQSMANLDFSQKWTTRRRDELGELGNSINHLSKQLGEAMDRLQEQNRKLQEDVEKERRLDRMRKDFVSAVSHELKTPLALILGYAEGLQEHVVIDEESQRYYCSVIADEAQKMDKLVKSLLNLSQLESGAGHLQWEEFDLAGLAVDVAQKYKTLLAEKEIDLTVDAAAPCFVYGDVLGAEQIITNFLTNAFSHADGERKVRLWLEPMGTHWRLQVENTGKTIPEDSLDKIWTSFYKVDKARTRQYGGHGLGLSIVRAIQEAHGNAFGAENTPDGVLFWADFDEIAAIPAESDISLSEER